MKSPKSPPKEQPFLSANLCKIHKDIYSMICLHTGCHSSYKLLCPKCKKQKHYQHPNRVINLHDFYSMLQNNKLDFIQNSLALTLVNIKNKLVYVSNFRIFILEKQAMLMDSARTIHTTIYKILQQKTQLKSLLSHLNDQMQIQNADQLINSLDQLKKNISYNPIQNLIRINSDKVGVMKVELQKYCQNTKNVINDIRQYLVKIVQVMIEEEIEEEDIEYIEHEDVDERIFNINVKKANHIEINQKQTRYKVQQLKQMFDSLLNLEIQKNQEHIENDVQKLQQEIKFKQEIVHNIRRRSASKAAKYSVSDEIKQTTSTPVKSSFFSSQTQHNNSEAQKDSSKISLNSPKHKDQKVVSRNVARYQMGSPKSPKVRSITDKGNTSPRAIVCNEGLKSDKKNPVNKRTPKSNLKNSEYCKSQIKENTQNQKSHRKQQEVCESALRMKIEKIDQSEEELLLQTDPFDYELQRASLIQQDDESLLLQESQQNVHSFQIRQLTSQIQQLQNQNQNLKLQLNLKIHQIHTLTSTFQQYKDEMNAKLNKMEQELTEAMQKQSPDNLQSTSAKQNKLMMHSSPVNKNKDKKTPEKQQDKLKKGLQQNAVNNKRLLDQKKELETKNQKLQKQLKQLKEKEVSYKHEQSINAQNVKELKQFKKKLQQLTKKNQQLNKKNDQIIKKNDQIVKKNQELLRKNDQISKENDKIGKQNDKLRKDIDKQIKENDKTINQNIQLEKNNNQLTQMLQQASQKAKELLKQQDFFTKNNEEMSSKLEQMAKKSDQMEKNLTQYLETIEQQKQSINEQKDMLQEQKQTYSLNIQKRVKDLRQQMEEERFNWQLKEKNFQKEVNKLSNDLQQALTRQKSIEEQLNEAKQVIKVQQQKIFTYERSQNQQEQRQNHQKQQKRLIQLNQSLQKQLNQMSMIIQQSEVTIRQLQAKISENCQISERYKNKIKDDERNITNSESIIKKLQTQISFAQNSHQEALNKVTSLESVIKSHQTQIESHKVTIQKKSEQINRLHKQIEQLTVEKIQELEVLTEKKIGQKIWFKDQEISALEQRNYILTSQLNQLQSSTSDHNQFQKPNSISLKNLIEEPLGNKTKLQQSQESLPKTFNRQKDLEQQLSKMEAKCKKLQEQYSKLRKIEANQKKQHEKIQREMAQQCQYFKNKFEQEKDKNHQTAQFDINNFVPLLKHKQLKQWYEIAMRKNHELKQQIAQIKIDQSRLFHQYEQKIAQTNKQCDNKICEILKHHSSQFNQPTFREVRPQTLAISFQSKQTANQSESTLQPSSSFGQSIQISSNEINAQNSPIMFQKYSEIQTIMQQITGDMLLLEEKVKENTVIQKVYLKELDRKRTQNRKLRQEIDEYRNRQRKVAGVRTDRYFEKVQAQKGKPQKPEYKVYYATGFVGSESRLSGGSSLIPGNHYHITQDHFTSSNQSPSTLSNNSNRV